MKNKLVAITLSIACVLASCVPSALANFNHVEVTSVELEEVSEQPTWNVLQKQNDDIQRIYQETYDRVYQETLNNLAQQQAEIQANNENVMNQLKNSDIMKWFQANNEKVVKDIDYDKNGNLVVKYSNGTQKSLTNKVASVPIPTPQVVDCEQVGYVLKNSVELPWQYGINLITVSDVKVELVDINDNIPYQKYHYKCSINYTFHNTTPTGRIWLFFDDSSTADVKFALKDNNMIFDYYSYTPKYVITKIDYFGY